MLQNETVQFLPETLTAIVFMVVITTAVFCWSAKQLRSINASNYEIGIAYLTALTIAVPPGLVACLSIGISLSILRLNRKNIIITDTGKLKAAGTIEYVCFDKTGTLTDQRITCQGLRLYKDKQLQVIRTGLNNRSYVQQVANEIMSTCHSLSVVDGKVVGDPLEVELFSYAGWSLELSDSTNEMVFTPPYGQTNGELSHSLVRQFEFTPLTFVLDLHNDTAEAFINSFVKAFEENMPKNKKKKYDDKVGVEFKRKLRPLLNIN